MTTTQQVHLFIAQKLFHLLLDGVYTGNRRAEGVMWRTIDRHLKAAKATREDL